MSLLLTSCTMGKQPDRLLNKGPQYLRTRTNSGLFVHNKTSAVELLAASKAQYYSVKHTVDLDKQQDLAVSQGQNNRYSQSFKKKEPTRSKSEYDISQLHLARTDEESDENNNDISDDSLNVSNDVIADAQVSHFEDEETASKSTHNSNEENETKFENALNNKEIHVSSLDITLKPTKSNSEFIFKFVYSLKETDTNLQLQSQNGTKTVDNEPESLNKKPVPLPRKLKEKPVPPPRKRPSTAPSHDTEQTSNQNANNSDISRKLSLTHQSIVVNSQVQETSKLKESSVNRPSDATSAATSTINLSKKRPSEVSEQTSNQNLNNSDISRKHNLTPQSTPINILAQETSKLIKESSVNRPTKTKSAIISVTKPPLPEKPKKLLIDLDCKKVTEDILPEKPKKLIKELDCKKVTEDSIQTYIARPIYINKPIVTTKKLESKKVNFVENGESLTQSSQCVIDASLLNGLENINGKRRCPDMSSSVRAAEREPRNLVCSVGGPRRESVISFLDSSFESGDKSKTVSTSTLEMSIESVDQAVYETEISAIPTAFVEATIMNEADPEIREITRSNSSLSGKFDPQNSSPLSASPTPHCSSVPRSYSDISCHLEGQHSRDSSIVSSHNRLSHAGIGTDLEYFFNQMGLEKGILDPTCRLKEPQPSEVFDSMSSLDSHDAASLCSTYSCSDQEWSDSQSTDRNQQQTSIVERNARIIKWLCNVRKAKNQSQKPENAAANNA